MVDSNIEKNEIYFHHWFHLFPSRITEHMQVLSSHTLTYTFQLERVLAKIQK